MNVVRVLKLAVLGLLVSPLLASAGEKFKPEFDATLDATGNAVIAHPWRELDSKVGFGGNLSFEWRPLSLFAIGTQLTGREFCDADEWDLMTWDVEGKLFPLGRTAKGEAYLEAAVGRVITTSNRINLPGKRVHGSLGAGYRFFCVSNPKRFLDLGLLYDGYTPRKAPVNTLSVKVGVGLLFGSCCAKSDTKATSKVEAKVPEKAAAKDEVKASAKVEPKATVTAEVKRPVKASAKAKKMVAEKTPTETK